MQPTSAALTIVNAAGIGCSDAAGVGCSQPTPQPVLATLITTNTCSVSTANTCSQHLQPRLATNTCSQHLQPTPAANTCSVSYNQHLQLYRAELAICRCFPSRFVPQIDVALSPFLLIRHNTNISSAIARRMSLNKWSKLHFVDSLRSADYETRVIRLNFIVSIFKKHFLSMKG